MNDLTLNRRQAVTLPLAGLVVTSLIADARSAAAATNDRSLVPADASKLRTLTAALAAAPRRRTFRSVPMILVEPTQWDSAALDLLLNYDGGPKQVWDNTALDSPWLNLMRNAMNAQIWSWGHPDFLAISATHGSAHLALYDDYIWQKYLRSFTGGKYHIQHLDQDTVGGELQPARLRGSERCLLAGREQHRRPAAPRRRLLRLS